MKRKYKSFLVVSTLSAVFALSGCSNAVYRTSPNMANNVNRTQTSAQRAVNRRMTNNAVTGHGYGYSRSATVNRTNRTANHINRTTNNNGRSSITVQRENPGASYARYNNSTRPLTNGAVSGINQGTARNIRSGSLANSAINTQHNRRNTVIVPPIQSKQGIAKVDGTRNINQPTVKKTETHNAAPKKLNTAPKTAAIKHAEVKNKVAAAPKTTVAKATPAPRNTAPRIANNAQALVHNTTPSAAPRNTAPRLANNTQGITRSRVNNRRANSVAGRNVENTHRAARSTQSTRARQATVNRSLINDSNVSINRNLINNSNLNSNRNLVNNNRLAMDSYYNDYNDGIYNNVITPVSSVSAPVASDIDVQTHEGDNVIIIDDKSKSDNDTVIIDNDSEDKVINLDGKNEHQAKDNTKNVIGKTQNTIGTKTQLVPVTGNNIHKSQLAPNKTNIGHTGGNSIGNTGVNNTNNNNPLVPNNNANEAVINNGNNGNDNNNAVNNVTNGTENNVTNNNTTGNELLTVDNDINTEETPAQDQPTQQAPKASGFQRFFKKGK